MSQSHGTSIHFPFHNSHKCRRNISTTTCSSEFVPSVLNAGSTTRGKCLLPPLLLSLHEPQHLAKILASLIITDLSNNMMLMEVFQRQNQIQAEFSSAHSKQHSALQQDFLSAKRNRNIQQCFKKKIFRNVIRTLKLWTFFSCIKINYSSCFTI